MFLRLETFVAVPVNGTVTTVCDLFKNATSFDPTAIFVTFCCDVIDAEFTTFPATNTEPFESIPNVKPAPASTSTIFFHSLMSQAPVELSPTQATVPSSNAATVCLSPAATSIAFLISFVSSCP
ncbi:hypothetical protein SDC9_168584 [bioreactor metagenome]|uniref:Uncharacterized protein n=1 Tax=bioreactor metagenome TaxID=1076179 RepID=A0A645G3I5_9ZZZZ